MGSMSEPVSHEPRSVKSIPSISLDYAGSLDHDNHYRMWRRRVCTLIGFIYGLFYSVASAILMHCFDWDPSHAVFILSIALILGVPFVLALRSKNDRWAALGIAMGGAVVILLSILKSFAMKKF